MIGSLTSQQQKNPFAAIMLLFFMVVTGIVWILHKLLGGGTKIQVTPDAVIVDGKRMARSDFGGFSINSTFKIPNREETLAVLGYSFGHRGFAFGGAWDHQQATEVASALNKHLRKTPEVGDENEASPEQLRAARPTDF